MAANPHLTLMLRAAEKAGRSLARDFGEIEHLQVSEKAPGDFVSAADRRAEKIIFEELQGSYPDYCFLMEESGKIDGKNTDYRWIIDPLDGTANFLHGIPQWAISIALEHKNEIILGLVYDPVKNETFTAEKGQGAFTGRHRLRVSGRRDALRACITTGAPRRAKETHEQFFKEQRAIWNMGASLRRFGSASLDLAYVAAGRFEGFWERDLAPWDIAAGILLVREAGGFVCDIDDDRKNPMQTGAILAANEAIYGEMKKTLRSV